MLRKPKFGSETHWDFAHLPISKPWIQKKDHPGHKLRGQLPRILWKSAVHRPSPTRLVANIPS